jgi:hypothetical protein
LKESIFACLVLPVALAAVTLGSWQAVGRTISDEQMIKLDLAARVEQRCNRRAMGLIGREHRGFIRMMAPSAWQSK